MQSNKRKGFLKHLAVLGLGLGLGLGMSASHAAGEKFVLISHAPDSDSWWNTIKNSVKQAGEDFNVTVDYRNPPNGDLADMARLASLRLTVAANEPLPPGDWLSALGHIDVVSVAPAA